MFGLVHLRHMHARSVWIYDRFTESIDFIWHGKSTKVQESLQSLLKITHRTLLIGSVSVFGGRLYFKLLETCDGVLHDNLARAYQVDLTTADCISKRLSLIWWHPGNV